MDAVQDILNLFEQVAAIPRASKHEEQISRWLQDWAAQRGLTSQSDQAGNVVIRVPATPGYEQAPTIILQGHMDMVCEKTPDSPHDFARDPIRCIVDGDWLHADRTTLGADNGIAIAIALALVDNPQVAHPPLELLFTVEEEIGLGGVAELQPDFVNGKILLNLDSELEGVFVVGCAGGATTHLYLPLAFEPAGERQMFTIAIGGLSGGHSGLDINKQRASANKLLARLLGEISAHAAFRLAGIKGGTAHNAIARDAQVVLAFEPDARPLIEKAVHAFRSTLLAEFAPFESGLSLNVAPGQAERVLTQADTLKVIAMLQALPHGVDKMSTSLEGAVETSNNLATLVIENDELHITTSQRSMVMAQLDQISRRIAAVAHLAGARVVVSSSYPAWQPNLNSPLLTRCVETYQQLFNQPARVETIHAGLECGQIGKIFGQMDMISIGVTLLDPHSPNERLYIPALHKVWALLVGLLSSYQPPAE